MASIPVELRPPWVKISQRSDAAAALDPLGVDRDHDALLAEFFGAPALTNSRLATAALLIETLSAPGAQQRLDVVDGAHAAADGQRHEAGFRRAPHDIEHGAAVFVGGGDVEEAELVGAGGVVGDRRFDGIAGVAQIDEVDALDHPAVLDVEAGDHADLEHRLSPKPRRALRISASAAAGSSRPS